MSLEDDRERSVKSVEAIGRGLRVAGRAIGQRVVNAGCVLAIAILLAGWWIAGAIEGLAR